MIYKYNKGQQDNPLNTDHLGMSLSWKARAQEWIFSEVVYSYEEFDNPLSCINFISVAFELDRHRFDRINGSTLNFCGHNVYDQ